jgi:hypothetical protein
MIPPSSDLNAYEPAPAAAPVSWSDAWISAIIRPSEATYRRIGYASNASFWRAAIWLFVASIIGFVISALAGLAFGAPQFQQLEEATGVDLGSIVGVLGLLVCAAPFGAALGVGLAALWTALIQWIAKLMGGEGDFNALFNAVAAYSAPMGIISALFSAIPIPYISACIGALIGIYNLVLSVIAVQAINRFGYGKAIATVLIPAALLLTCCCLFYFLLAATLFAAFPEIQNIMPTFPAP